MTTNVLQAGDCFLSLGKHFFQIGFRLWEPQTRQYGTLSSGGVSKSEFPHRLYFDARLLSALPFSFESEKEN
jgi:hypothetical protein